MTTPKKKSEKNLGQIKNAAKKAWTWLKGNIKLTLLISLVGGVPGLINIRNWALEKPDFYFYTKSISGGEYFQMNQGKIDNLPVIIMTGAIYNDGKKPLFPMYFRVKLEYDDGRNDLDLLATPMPDKLNMTSDSKMNIDSTPQRDLTRTTRVNPSDAVYGTIWFIANKGQKIDNYTKMTLTCLDIEDKEFSCKVDIGRYIHMNGYYRDPKTGTTMNE